MSNASEKVSRFIGGAPKCGTTFLVDRLRASQETAIDAPKEFDTFKGSHFTGSPPYADVKDTRNLIDGSPTYLADSEAPRLIAAYNPSARLTFVLRPPIERIASQLQFHIMMGLAEPGTSLREFIVSRRAFEYYDVVAAGQYGQHVQRYLTQFTEERVQVLTSHSLRRSTQECIQRVAAHLQLTERTSPIPGQAKTNTSKGLKHPRLYKTVRNLGRAAASNPIGRVATNSTVGQKTWQSVRSLFFADGKNTISYNDWTYTAQFYKHDIENLGILAGADLSSWLDYDRYDSGAAPATFWMN